jgi:hypothetical protein
MTTAIIGTLGIGSVIARQLAAASRIAAWSRKSASM